MNITPSQKEVIEKVKTAFRYKYGLKEFNINDQKYFLSVTGTGDFFMNHFQAIIGKRGGISLYREGNIEWKGKRAEFHIDNILEEMASKGLYQYPERKHTSEPTIYGIQFYSTGERKRHGGFYSIGIHRNTITEKYFKWAFPDEDMWGTIFEYSYMSNGGDGLILIDVPTGERERVSFSYEPYQAIYVRGTDYEEEIKGHLTNRQIIAKVFKTWLKNKGLL